LTNVTLETLRHRRLRCPPLLLDGILFAGSAIFAVSLWSVSDLSAHRDWGRDAIVGYVACALAACILAVVHPKRVLRARVVLTAVCFVLVALVPMILMVRARVESRGELHVLPEVAVIERAGHRLADGRDPYVAQVIGHRLIGQVPGVPRYEAFFPYFPAMTVFGLPSTVSWLDGLGDGRLWMALVTVGLLLVGLWLARAPPDRALRTAQVLCVLPTGAVFLAGGGDDLPILAISFVGMAAILRRRTLGAGIAFGLAMAMKLTAWPLAALSLFIVRDEGGRRVPGKVFAIVVAIVAVFVIPFAIWDPRTFLVNTIAFPLGLSSVNSPAASPLPGHVISALVPGAHRALLIGLVIVGSPLLAWWLWRRPPKDVSDVCRLTAIVAIVVMCVAPATRVGYVVYPVNLLVWSWLFATPPDARDVPARSARLGGLEESERKGRLP
jgi:hypothetical protein